MIKSLKKLGTEGMYLNMLKAIYEKLKLKSYIKSAHSPHSYST
jgi:hypothetical protein